MVLIFCYFLFFFFFKQKTEYEMRIRYWSSDVCSSDLSGASKIAYGSLGAVLEGPLAPPLTLSSACRSCCAIPLRSSGAALATVGCAAAARIPEDRHQKTAAGCLPSALPPALDRKSVV